MVLFNLAYRSELSGKLRKSLFLGCLGKVFVHICPFVVFTVCGSLKVCLCIAYSCKLLEPHLSVFLFVIRSFQEKGGHLLIALFFRYGCKICILVSCLRFSCKRFLKILFGLCACILVFSHFFILLYCGLLTIKNCRLFTLIIVRGQRFVNKPMMQKMLLDKRFLPVYNKYILLCYEREI